MAIRVARAVLAAALGVILPVVGLGLEILHQHLQAKETMVAIPILFTAVVAAVELVPLAKMQGLE